MLSPLFYRVALLILLAASLIPASRHGQVLFLPGLGLTGGDTQYAGFIDISSRSSLFYWIFEAKRPEATPSPLIIWLQGGPGSTSMFGLFTENGPYTVDDQLKLKRNAYSWNNSSNLMFIDYPFGTGYSYTDNGDYIRNDQQGANVLVDFLSKFYNRYPNYRQGPLFITGESYAGKYIPSVGAAIHKWNDNHGESEKIPLAGIAIGGAWMHPESQVPAYTTYAFYTGLIDAKQKAEADVGMGQVLELANAGRTQESTDLWDVYAERIYDQGGRFSTYDIRVYGGHEEDRLPFQDWLELPHVRDSLFVGERNVAADDGQAAFDALRPDDMVSALQYLPSCIANGRVLLYNGQFDFIVNHVGVQSMLENKVDWDGRDSFRDAPRTVWKVDAITAGTWKSFSNLTFMMVVNAGHMVPTDQPRHALEMIERFVFNRGFAEDPHEDATVNIKIQ